jgi:hypothetical protein
MCVLLLAQAMADIDGRDQTAGYATGGTGKWPVLLGHTTMLMLTKCGTRLAEICRNLLIFVGD